MLVDEAELDVDVDAPVVVVLGLVDAAVVVVVSTEPPAPPLPLSSSAQPTETPTIANSTAPTQVRFRMARRIGNHCPESKRVTRSAPLCPSQLCSIVSAQERGARFERIQVDLV